LSLVAQGEIAELADPADPAGADRGGSSAMPHKRNPVSAMIALAAAHRTPQQAATLLACMGQQHERGLGNWQAELAVWPALFLSAHGALAALDEAFAGLQVDTVRMQQKIDALQGLAYAEAVTIHLAAAIGRPQAHVLLQRLTRATVDTARPLADIVIEAVGADPALRKTVDIAALRDLFDARYAAARAAALARRQLTQLQDHVAAMPAAPLTTNTSL
jgi:3-carboxy-cis,cis-muconate cycloisomerase